MKKFILFALLATSFLTTHAQNRIGQLKHVVLFTFKASSSAQEVENVAHMSPEHLDQGFTHCFTLTFNSEKDLADYQSHPEHKAFQTILKPHMDKVFVVDYFVEPNN